MPQVLPEVYNYDSKYTLAKEYIGPTGGLCGKLSILIGLAAFSTGEEDAENSLDMLRLAKMDSA
jgi:hypothetical protein